MVRGDERSPFAHCDAMYAVPQGQTMQHAYQLPSTLVMAHKLHAVWVVTLLERPSLAEAKALIISFERRLPPVCGRQGCRLARLMLQPHCPTARHVAYAHPTTRHAIPAAALVATACPAQTRPSLFVGAPQQSLVRPYGIRTYGARWSSPRKISVSSSGSGLTNIQSWPL